MISNAAETVHYLTPEQTYLLLANSEIDETLIAARRAQLTKEAAKHADRLLGDYNEMEGFGFLNDLPATAAGLEPVIVISSKRAEELLGDGHKSIPSPK